MCSFSRIAQKIKYYSAFNFLPEKLENFRSTELYGAALEGSTIFLCRSSLCCTSIQSCQLADLKYAIFSSTGCKTKKLLCSKLFLSMVFNPIQARLFLGSCGQGGTLCPLRPGGHIVPPFENHVPLVLTAYCKVFLKACPMLDHMTHFGFHGNYVKCVLRWLKHLCSTKTSNQRYCTNCIIFGIS